jgi:hypothetical protein
MEQGLYVESIIRDLLGPMFAHATLNFLDAQIVSLEGSERVQEMHRKWLPATQYGPGN